MLTLRHVTLRYMRVENTHDAATESVVFCRLAVVKQHGGGLH